MPTILIAKETASGERRVAGTPETVKKMVKAGLEVVYEPGCGVEAGFLDAAYEQAGARPAGDPVDTWGRADAVLKVTPPEPVQLARLRSGAILVSLVDPYRNLPLVKMLVDRGVTSFAMELVPRVTRAQEMDVLSSQASIAGYKAVLLAGLRLGKYFPLLMTAAGTIQPSRIIVLGAGVAGLQAIATAKRLGAVVEVSDIRAEVKEQVESLGGKFIELPEMQSGAASGGYAKEVTPEFLDKQRAILKQRLAAADVAITTAQVPGKKAPILLTREMVEAMKPGSVVVDIAASSGGNCELTQLDRDVVHHNVLILGPGNLPATMATDASILFARNVLNFLMLNWKDNQLSVHDEDEIVAGTLLTRDGKIVHPGVAKAAGAA